MLLEIKDLKASVEGKAILKGINLKMNKGEVHAIMGPNGSGKSTLASVIAGKEEYEVTDGSILFNGKDILELSPDERAKEGMFLAFQYPVEIPGVSYHQLFKDSRKRNSRIPRPSTYGSERFFKNAERKTKAGRDRY